MDLAPFDQVAAAKEDSCLRPAEELVAADEDEVRSFAQGAGCGHLLGQTGRKLQRAAAEVMQERDAPLA